MIVPSRTNPLLAFLTSIAAFGIRAVICFLAITTSLRLAYGWGHPHDQSAGDAAGWALLIGSPVFIPVILCTTVAASIWTFRRLRRPLDS